MTRSVAVDFDGVIHAYSRGWQDGIIYDEPMPGAIDAIRQLQANGYAVFIHTTRNVYQVAEWMIRHDFLTAYCCDGPDQPRIEFWDQTDCLLITNKKYPAVAYIDDRGIRFTSWPQALADLARYEQAAEHG